MGGWVAHPSTHPNLDPTGEGEGSLNAAAAAAAAATAAAVAVLLPEPSRLTKMALNTAVLATSHPTWLELADVAQRQSA